MQFPISGEYCAHHLVNEPTSTDAGAYFDLDTCCDEYRVLREKKSQVIYIRKGVVPFGWLYRWWLILNLLE